jgi:hypothetical protein
MHTVMDRVTTRKHFSLTHTICAHAYRCSEVEALVFISSIELGGAAEGPGRAGAAGEGHLSACVRGMGVEGGRAYRYAW